MMTKTKTMPADKVLKQKLQQAQNLGEMFREIENHYDLDNTRMGFAAKNILIAKIDVIVDFLNPPRKNNRIRSYQNNELSTGGLQIPLKT